MTKQTQEQRQAVKARAIRLSKRIATQGHIVIETKPMLEAFRWLVETHWESVDVNRRMMGILLTLDYVEMYPGWAVDYWIHKNRFDRKMPHLSGYGHIYCLDATRSDGIKPADNLYKSLAHIVDAILKHEAKVNEHKKYLRYFVTNTNQYNFGDVINRWRKPSKAMRAWAFLKFKEWLLDRCSYGTDNYYAVNAMSLHNLPSGHWVADRLILQESYQFPGTVEVRYIAAQDQKYEMRELMKHIQACCW